MPPIVLLLLGDRHGHDGRACLVNATRRIVAVDLSREDERRDIQKFTDPDCDNELWGLASEDGWWRILDVFEIIEPTDELHEGKYPVSLRMPDDAFIGLMAAFAK